jgi:hypothetical protein
MRIDPVLTLGNASDSPRVLPPWRVGMVLSALATRDPAGQLWLSVGSGQYRARFASGEGTGIGNGPQNGEVLRLRVLRDSPVVAVEVLPAESDAASTNEASALRLFLPRQITPALLMANLGWLSQHPQDAQSLPKSVAEAVQRLWQALPNMSSLTHAAGVEAALAKSGMFLEALLANGNSRTLASALSGDLKALMLGLSRALNEQGVAARPTSAALAQSPSPMADGGLTSLPAQSPTLANANHFGPALDELAWQTDGALARLTTLQLMNTARDPSLQSWLFELPVRNGEDASLVRFKLEREASPEPDSIAPLWTLETAMDLGAAGPLHARIMLRGLRISVQLRAESPQLVESLQTHQSSLASTLQSAGLSVDRIVCLHGLPAADTGQRTARLLDTHA